MNQTHPLHGLRTRLLDALLPQVVFDGWSQEGLVRAAESIGESADAVAAAFPRGGVEALLMFLTRCDSENEARIRANPAPQKIREKITEGVMGLLVATLPHREAMRRGLSLLALPVHAADGAKALWHTANSIWHAIGDTSTDMNYYSKRALLSGVYASTLLVWLDDATPDLAITRRFLERRIGDVMRIETGKRELKKFGDALGKWFPFSVKRA